MMPWFKFYGQEFLTDPKVLSLSAVERALWLTILCLANNTEDGVIKYITSAKIMDLAGLDRSKEEWKENDNFLKRFETLSMITSMITDGVTSIKVTHFLDRQKQSMTGYERVKKYRENHKVEAKDDNEMITDDNVINDNARQDKIREDKNIKSDMSLPVGKPSPQTGKKWERPEPEKQSKLQKIVYHLEDTLHTKVTNWGKQGEAYKLMYQAGYTDDQILKAITYLATKDDFFKDKGFDLMTVSNQLPLLQAKAAKARGGVYAPSN